MRALRAHAERARLPGRGRAGSRGSRTPGNARCDLPLGRGQYSERQDRAIRQFQDGLLHSVTGAGPIEVKLRTGGEIRR